MGRKHRKMRAKRLSLDRITALPEPIIETILCLLPIDAAVRTSILSKKWRYKWTTIPNLVFDRYALELESNKSYTTSKLLSAILHVLLLRRDPIHEFTLLLDNTSEVDYAHIDSILLYLSRNHTLKRLALRLDEANDFNVPLFVFNGFGRLTSLSLECLWMRRKAFLNLLSNCPLLKSLTLCLYPDNVLGHEPPIMAELFECLPVIEHLTIRGETVRFLVADLVSRQLPTSLLHLKYIYLKFITLVDRHDLTFLAVLIKCSPNLEKIEIEINRHIECEENETDILKEYSDVWLGHLLELNITYYSNSKAELEFLKFIVARSPKLKKVGILDHFVERNQESEMLKTLSSSRTPRASACILVFVP